MKSSGDQFFQLLRQITNPLNPYKVVNLYHELRRLSRLWRWVKKLRWADMHNSLDNQSIQSRVHWAISAQLAPRSALIYLMTGLTIQTDGYSDEF